jgi:hypothetical protein
MNSPQNSLNFELFQYVQQLTVFDLVIARRTITLKSTDISNEHLPTAVKIMLSLGDKFIPFKPFDIHDFDSAVDQFVRKLKLRVYFDDKLQDERVSKPFFHTFRALSSWIPKIDADVDNTLNRWANGLKQKARKANQLAAPGNYSFFIKRAINWLKQNSVSFCKIAADKNYGPTVISAKRIQSELDKETSSGDYQAITEEQYIWDLMRKFDYLTVELESANLRGLIDSKTQYALLKDFRDHGLPNPSAFNATQLIEAAGRIRYLVKLHKPGCKLRRVEVDTHSPFNDLASFASQILGQVVAILETTVRDSKEVLISIRDDPVPLDDLTVFMAADLEDYYPSINVESLKDSIAWSLTKHFGHNPSATDFALKIIGILLSSKVIHINGQLFRKIGSLSIGEKIATDCANIHREFSFGPILSQARVSGLLKRFWGYVDDAAAILSGSRSEIAAFQAQLQAVDVRQFRWVFELSTSKLVFLDLHIQRNGVSLMTKNFQKPAHNPQYIHACSYHPQSCMKHVFASQALRFMVNCSNKSDYEDCCDKLRERLQQRMHSEHWLQQVPYDDSLRQAYLDSIKRRRSNQRPTSSSLDPRKLMFVVTYSKLMFVVTYSKLVQSMQLQEDFKHLQQQLQPFPALQSCTISDAQCILAFRSNPNIFRLTYRHNFPVPISAQHARGRG